MNDVDCICADHLFKERAGGSKNAGLDPAAREFIN